MAWAVWSARVVGIGSKSEGDICSKKKSEGDSEADATVDGNPTPTQGGFFSSSMYSN